MHLVNTKRAVFALLAASVASASGSLWAQQPSANDISVYGETAPDPATMTAGPDVEGIISARYGDKIKVTAADGSSTVFFVSDATRVRAGGGLFGGGGGTLGTDSLLNGLPVSVKTLQGDGVYLATQVTFKSKDLKTANMIRNGTAQGFAQQSAATESLRGRMGDIDKYNIKSTMSVYFDTGKWALSPQAKAELCNTATAAQAMDNALLLVVGYTDSVGNDEYNQVLSEKRAGTVTNYLQQVCRWKLFRMLTPTGMAESDPMADNSTPEGRAQNRRVSVNVLVSKGVDVD